MAAIAELRIVVDDIRRRPDNACRYARKLQRRHQVLRVPVAGDGGYALVDRVTILPTTMGRGQLRRPRKGRITKDLAQSRPRFILPGGNGNPSVLAQAAKDTMRRLRRSLVDDAFLDPIVGAAVAHGGAEQRNGWLGLGHVNVLTHSRPPTMAKRGQDRKGRMAWVWNMVGEVGPCPGRFALRKTREELQAGQGSHCQTIAEVFVLGARSTLHRHRNVNDVWLDRPDRVVAKAELLHGTGSKVVGDVVARRNQPPCQVLARFGLQVERDAPLAAVAIPKISAAIDPRH